MSKLKFKIEANCSNTKFKRIWNHLIGKGRKEISQFFARMNNKRLIRFLKFMHETILIDKLVDYIEECLKHYRTILMCCPIGIMTYFLLEIDKPYVVELLEQRNDLWITYFVGIIQIGYMKDLDDLVMTYLRRIYQDDYILTLIKLLIGEVSNENLSYHIRQYIFDYIYASPNMVLFMIPRENEEEPATFEELIDQMDQWSLTFPQWMIDEIRFVPEPEQPPEHRAIDAEAFVCTTFPSQHPLCRDRVYQCGICHSGPDDTNEDGIKPVFRSMPCCGHRQMACHGCLANQATECNTPDREFKDTSVFTCPFGRHKIKFLLPKQ